VLVFLRICNSLRVKPRRRNVQQIAKTYVWFVSDCVCVFVVSTADCKLKVLGRLFCADGQHVSGERRKLRTEELHELCNPTFCIRLMILKRARFAQHVECAGGGEKCVENCMEKRKEAIGRPEHKFHDIIMDLKGTGLKACSGFFWLRICTMWTRQWTFGFLKLPEIFLQSDEVRTVQETPPLCLLGVRGWVILAIHGHDIICGEGWTWRLVSCGLCYGQWWQMVVALGYSPVNIANF